MSNRYQNPKQQKYFKNLNLEDYKDKSSKKSQKTVHEKCRNNLRVETARQLY
ncbi:hypothetical protein [Acinetobacter chinensis]|uniref:hypothetical protein n=1 Tax=Acinetobacter chinensis TaxID=2004650 RepID=UPI00135AE14C|nr:hypothetical protein [Acinetobacter chinensis]